MANELGLGEFSPAQQVFQGLHSGFSGTPIDTIQTNARQKQLVERLRQQADNPNVMQGKAAQMLAIDNPELLQKMGKALGTTDQARQKSFFEDMGKMNRLLDGGQFQLIPGLLSNRIEKLQAVGGDATQTIEIANQFQQALSSGDSKAMGALAGEVASVVKAGELAGYLPSAKQDKVTLGPGQVRFVDGEETARGPEKTTGAGSGKTAKIQEFEFLTEGLDDEQKKHAALVSLGLEGRAIENALMNIADKGIAEQVGDASAIIKEREKFGAMTGASRAKAIDKGFDKLVSIDASMRNMDRAIKTIKAGAGVGAIEKIFPSFKAASVALDNIQGAMALDVVGATTFGALSKGELDLAKAIALPTGLDSDELIQHLKDKRVAQQKLRDYFNEQIQFLDQGGTVAGFLRQKDREMGGGGGDTGGGADGQPKFLGFE